MHLTITNLLLPFIASSAFAKYHARPTPRSLDAILVEPRAPEVSPSPTPFLRRLDLRDAAPTSPYLKHLDLRQVAPAQPQPPAAPPAAPAN